MIRKSTILRKHSGTTYDIVSSSMRVAKRGRIKEVKGDKMNRKGEGKGYCNYNLYIRSMLVPLTLLGWGELQGGLAYLRI